MVIKASDSVDFSILMTGYCGDGFEITSRDNWMGLFETDTGFELRSVELLIEPNDDNPYQINNLYISIAQERNPLFLLWSRDSLFTEGSVTAVLAEQTLLPLDTVVVLEGHYELLISLEGVFLSHGAITQQLSELVSDPDMEVFVSLLWIGDLDGDLEADMILSEQSEPGCIVYSLFLSREADSGFLVKKVVSLVHYGIG